MLVASASIADLEHELDGEQQRWGMCGYFMLCFAGNGCLAAMAILLWSKMGIGERMFEILADYHAYKIYPFGVSVIILATMYIFDLFLPREGTVYDNRRCLQGVMGKLFFAVAFCCFFVSCLLLQKSYPAVPLLLNILICPISMVAVRSLLHAREAVDHEKSKVLKEGTVELKMLLLRNIIGFEQDVEQFYQAATAAFFLVGVTCGIIWSTWVLAYNQGISNLSGLSTTEKDERYILWVTPLVVAIGNLVYSLFVMLRVFMQRMYVGTDAQRNALIADMMTSAMGQEIAEHRSKLLGQANVAAPDEHFLDQDEQREVLRQKFLQQDARSVRALSLLVKVVICIFILMLGFLYVAIQLLYADSQIATMVLGLLGVFFLVFVTFTYLSFRRIVLAMGQWIKDLPAWSAAKSLSTNDWVRALFLCPVLPAIPGVLLLSVVNQAVRKCRGVYKKQSEANQSSNPDSTCENPNSLCLTPRVRSVVIYALHWDFLSIAFRCYVLCAIFVGYNMTPPLLNVLLAWMRVALSTWHFSVIMIATFVFGVLAFLCPVVPGMTVYIFGGLVIANQCPPVGTDKGFWIGSIINVFMCWILKLAACAVQQKFIGEFLGNRLWVRQQVGVHKVAVRCIESILSKPGWTVGKVAILCGGPDWPTSVLAGVLRLSIVQCEIGTLPIFFFVLPCAMSGSLYLQTDRKDEVWARLANLTLISAVTVNMLLWAVAAWAIQNELSANYANLTKKIKSNLELEWMDYRSAEVAKKFTVTWGMVPPTTRTFYVGGAVAQVLICQAFWWAYYMLIGVFRVSDDIHRLEWYSGTLYHSTQGAPDDGPIELFSFASLILFGIYLISWTPFVVYRYWLVRVTRGPKTKALSELEREEDNWKKAWLEKLDQDVPRRSFQECVSGKDVETSPAETTKPAVELEEVEAGPLEERVMDWERHKEVQLDSVSHPL